MRLTVSALLVGLVVVGCSSRESPDPGTETVVPVTAGRGDDICAPGKAPDADEHPGAPCAIQNEYHVADLTEPPGADSGGSDLGTASLHFLDTAGTARASCNGKAGAGYTTCGTGAAENCCRTAAVPPGSAGTISVANGFELGVYEVTTARFTAFVNAVGGNVRGAATGGQLPGFNVAYAPKLPSSRAAVDEELGPACKFRSDVANYGARTWPSAQVTNTVASFITDDNDRAADIRADATSSRLMAKPVNCVSYYMAAAFCAWDGGRLPSNAEWAYTALGGSQLRVYPWGASRTADKLVTDLQHDSNSFTFPADFPYFDNGFNAYHIAPPGQKPAGASRWGHQDMGGNVLEWTADVSAGGGIIRGGSWEGHEDKNAFAFVNYPLDRTYGSLGFRCAYGSVDAPPPPPPPPPALTAPIYRSYNGAIGDHLQGLTQNEGAPTWRFEAVSFKLQKAAPANGSPLHRCRQNGTSFHFLSNAANCEGHTSEGLLGYTFKTAAGAQNTAPVYRCRSASGKDHLSTLTPAECTRAGFIIEGTQGYAIRP